MNKNMPLEELNIIFMGTSDFAAKTLAYLCEQAVPIKTVITQPDRPAGRKQVRTPSPVKICAQSNRLLIKQFEKFGKEELAAINALNPDIIIVSAYGLILPPKILSLPKFGCINIHASLLPLYRGPSPIQTALRSGDKISGVTIMLMDKGIDTGTILRQKKVEIHPDDTFPNVQEKIARAANDIIITTIKKYTAGKINPVQQDPSTATYTQLIKKSDGLIDWDSKAELIYNKYRAFAEWPQVYTYFDDKGRTKKLIIDEIAIGEIRSKSSPGQVAQKDGIIQIGTKTLPIIPKQVTLEGSKKMDIRSFINGKPHFIKTILTTKRGLFPN
ncbi:MAG: methionyl-tRNA formyltransferase [Patescibacteria group bacterium]|nr:methionyl-tRNA formyltransferase [Patescibacteria group bacterium]